MINPLHYQAYHPVDVVNGPGTRCTLFVSGCEHRCVGCYNAKTWRTDSGHRFTRDIEEHIIRDLNDSRIPKAGLSLSGGDPLHHVNVPRIKKLVDRVRALCPDKTIWCWTGYRIEELNASQRNIVECCDMLIDGRFVASLVDKSLPWRGSRNQRMLNRQMIQDFFHSH